MNGYVVYCSIVDVNLSAYNKQRTITQIAHWLRFSGESLCCFCVLICFFCSVLFSSLSLPQFYHSRCTQCNSMRWSISCFFVVGFQVNWCSLCSCNRLLHSCRRRCLFTVYFGVSLNCFISFGIPFIRWTFEPTEIVNCTNCTLECEMPSSDTARNVCNFCSPVVAGSKKMAIAMRFGNRKLSWHFYSVLYSVTHARQSLFVLR